MLIDRQGASDSGLRPRDHLLGRRARFELEYEQVPHQGGGVGSERIQLERRNSKAACAVSKSACSCRLL